MKKTGLIVLSAALAAMAVLFAGCSHAGGGNSSAVPAGTFSSSAADSQVSSQTDPASSETLSSEPPESEPGKVLTITTDDEAFNKKFAENPIDKAYIKESDEAVSTVDMVNVSQKYAAVWQKEIARAWSELQKQMSADSSGKPAQLKAEQQKWENGKDAALKKISDGAYAAGGSMAEVNAASGTMDFYRSRAAQLSRELYDYDKNYTYAFQSK